MSHLSNDDRPVEYRSPQVVPQPANQNNRPSELIRGYDGILRFFDRAGECGMGRVEFARDVSCEVENVFPSLVWKSGLGVKGRHNHGCNSGWDSDGKLRCRSQEEDGHRIFIGKQLRLHESSYRPLAFCQIHVTLRVLADATIRPGRCHQRHITTGQRG